MPEKKTMAVRKRVSILRTDIIKYPNRRLYSRIESRYITQRDFFELLKSGPVRVVEKKTSFDITARTIIAVIMELEEDGDIQLNAAEMRTFLLQLISPPVKAAA